MTTEQKLNNRSLYDRFLDLISYINTVLTGIALVVLTGIEIQVLIGHLQSNKTRDAAKYFDWVHTIDRIKVARRLAEQRPDDLPPLNVCVQVNVDEGVSKSGVAPAAAIDLALEVAALDRLRFRGWRNPCRHGMERVSVGQTPRLHRARGKARRTGE